MSICVDILSVSSGNWYPGAISRTANHPPSPIRCADSTFPFASSRWQFLSKRRHALRNSNSTRFGCHKMQYCLFSLNKLAMRWFCLCSNYCKLSNICLHNAHFPSLWWQIWSGVEEKSSCAQPPTVTAITTVFSMQFRWPVACMWIANLLSSAHRRKTVWRNCW